jgi:hypothetical protein
MGRFRNRLPAISDGYIAIDLGNAPRFAPIGAGWICSRIGTGEAPLKSLPDRNLRMWPTPPRREFDSRSRAKFARVRSHNDVTAICYVPLVIANELGNAGKSAPPHGVVVRHPEPPHDDNT